MSNPFTRGVIPLKVLLSHYTLYDPILRCVIPLEWYEYITRCVIPLQVVIPLHVVWYHYTLCDPITRGVILLHEVWSPNTWLDITDINVIMNVYQNLNEQH